MKKSTLYYILAFVVSTIAGFLSALSAKHQVSEDTAEYIQENDSE